MNGFLFRIIGIALLLLPGLLRAGDSPPKANVMVIFADDLGFSDLGCQGIQTDLKTPNIDSLASGGVRMTSGYVTAPQCVPSRGGLISGRYQNRFGLEANGRSLDGFNQQFTLPERLKEAGYVTGMAGKWHLGPEQEIASHGFDKFFFKQSNAAGFWNMNLEGKDVRPVQYQGGGYHIDVCSTFASSFIERFKDRPFFFYLAMRLRTYYDFYLDGKPAPPLKR